MPKDYEALRKKGYSKGAAARITNARRKKAGKPPAKFHRKKK